MKNQILEMLASPSFDTVFAFLRTLLRAPQESPLIAAIAAGLLGLFAAGLVGTWRSRRRQRKSNQHWQARLDDLDTAHQSKLSELNDIKDSLGKQVETLQNKVQSMEKTLEQDRSTLHKVNAQIKTLEVTAAEKDQKLQNTIDDAAHKIAQQQASTKKVKALLAIRTTELSELKARQADSAGLPISASLLNSIKERDDGYADQLAKRIDKLDEQRSTLLRERDELASREAHYTDQLIDGDDTRLYLDETIALGDDMDQLANQDSMKSGTAAIPDDLENTLAIDQPSFNDKAEQAISSSSDETTPSSLWERMKTTAVNTTDKAKIEQSDA